MNNLLNLKNQRGLTLIEVLINVAIVGVVLVFITFFSLDIFQFENLYGQGLEVQQEQQLTLRAMAQEMRGIGPADTGAYMIGAASANSLTFYSDYDGDGKFEQIRYYVVGTTLSRGVIISSGNPLTYPPANEKVAEVVHFLTNPGSIFSYYDQTFTGTEAPLASPIDVSKIRLLRVTLTADQNIPDPPGPSTQTLNITVRNLKLQ